MNLLLAVEVLHRLTKKGSETMYLKINDTDKSLISFSQTRDKIIFVFDEDISSEDFADISVVNLYSDDNMFLTEYTLENYDIRIEDNSLFLCNKATLEDVKKAKIEYLDSTCENTIYAGTDVTLSDGTIEHFTLDAKDQLDLSGIGLQLLQGAEQIAWHKDDETESCKFYSAADGATIIQTLTVFRTYHITYFRDLRIYVNSLSDADDVNAIEYGSVIPDEYKSDVLKSIEAQMGLASK